MRRVLFSALHLILIIPKSHDCADNVNRGRERDQSEFNFCGKAEPIMPPPVHGTGLKVGAGLHKRKAKDADADRLSEPGEGEKLRRLLSPPLARIDEYRLARVVTWACPFKPDEKFLSYRKGRRSSSRPVAAMAANPVLLSDARSPQQLNRETTQPFLRDSGPKPDL
jgi:hypothetical protein